MAKCIVCTHLNAVEEARRHPNAHTLAVVQALGKRRSQFNTKDHPNKFCKTHGVGGTGNKTGAFVSGTNLPIPFSTQVLNDLKERIARSQSATRVQVTVKVQTKRHEPDVPVEVLAKIRKHRGHQPSR